MSRRLSRLALVILIAGLIQCRATADPSKTADVPQRPRFNVAIFLADGIQILDYTPPYEVFAGAGMNVFTVVRDRRPITTANRMVVIPQYSYAESPRADILVLSTREIPGVFEDAVVREWFERACREATYILTVCGGLFPLQELAMLDGLTATTYAPFIPHLRAGAPRTRVVADRPFVDNGKIITAGAFMSGMDAALHIVARTFGAPRAREVANNLEYHWVRDPAWVRAKLPDRFLTALSDFNPPLRGRTLRYEGDETKWVAEYEDVRRESPLEIVQQIEEMAVMHRWRAVGTVRAGDDLLHQTSEDGIGWTCRVGIATNGERLRIRYTIERR